MLREALLWSTCKPGEGGGGLTADRTMLGREARVFADSGLYAWSTGDQSVTDPSRAMLELNCSADRARSRVERGQRDQGY